MVTFALVVALVLAVALLVGFVLGYNKLRTADVRVDEALGGIDVQLTRRAALIPGLVSAVQGYAAHEQSVLGRIADAQAALTAATAGKSIEQRTSAEHQFDTAVGQVMALGTTYPQLNSSNNFMNLQQNLADTEDKLAFARQYYNDAAADVNRLRSTIPWMFVAGMAGVGEREFYRVPK
ncbi:MAG: LemA family protein [Mycobacteriaceae bacterium]